MMRHSGRTGTRQGLPRKRWAGSEHQTVPVRQNLHAVAHEHPKGLHTRKHARQQVWLPVTPDLM